MINNKLGQTGTRNSESTVIIEDCRETTFLFQRLSNVRGFAEEKCGLILGHFPTRLFSHCSRLHLLL